MATLRSCLLFFFFFFSFSFCFVRSDGAAHVGRSSFPARFIFGTSSAAYQYEGGWNASGKGPSIWDTFVHQHPDKIANGSNGDVADDSYHRYKEDVRLMKEIGMDAYRFSISWSRILPNGSVSGGVNKAGVQYYNNLINELLANGIKPFVTMLHFDPPQGLEDEYGGFLSPLIVEDFAGYAEVLFREFGDRVKHWITINEPNSFAYGGYLIGYLAPGRCTTPTFGTNCAPGNSSTDPYTVMHHLLLSHSAAVKLYRDKYQARQGGVIGVSLGAPWYIPYSKSKGDSDAKQRLMDFMFGWMMDPLSYGDYPLVMKAFVGDRLPEFTAEQSEQLKGSFDFVGINYYTTSYAKAAPYSNNIPTASKSLFTDSFATSTSVRHGVPIGPQGASTWLYVYPSGIRDLLIYIKEKYNNPAIFITENGIDEANNDTLSLEEALDDKMRIDYHRQHLFYVREAIKKGVVVKGYFAWSLLDNFEWSNAYTVRFGIYYVDYKNGLKRYPKSSAYWFQTILKHQS